ncbi:MAG: Gfo/Idh/MocA family oxidoreductase [Mucilaginibacter polytrichastri]|nr:Gfo/Idh/MocA family oxidoreductase [Mucilaginibacter polytrichastri]
MQRRNFLKSTSMAAAGVTILNFPVFGKNAPSNKVVLGVMGVNSRGAYLAKCFSGLPGAEIAYICDVEEGAIKNGYDALKDARRKPKLEKDIRKLVARKDIDAIVVAAPDHWHAPAALLGVSHGKHVYVEKPCSHNPHEGEILTEAMDKYGKLIQMGNQRRSMPTLIEAQKMVKEGAIGKTYYGKAWYNNDRKPIGVGKKVSPPATLDFDLWQGPAPRRAFQDNLVHYNWHWFWHWGTSETCNNGTHEIDCCRWFLDVNFPNKVTSSGGRFVYKDDWETPDTQTASFEFPEGKLISWDGKSCTPFMAEKSGRGFIIYGDEGTLVNMGNGDYTIYDKKNKVVKEVKPDAGGDATNAVSANGNLDLFHLENFLKGVRGEAKINSPVSEGHKSVLLCHLASIAQRTGSTLHCDPANGHILQNPEAEKLWQRSYEPGWEMKIV